MILQALKLWCLNFGSPRYASLFEMTCTSDTWPAYEKSGGEKSFSKTTGWAGPTVPLQVFLPSSTLTNKQCWKLIMMFNKMLTWTVIMWSAFWLSIESENRLAENKKPDVCEGMSHDPRIHLPFAVLWGMASRLRWICFSRVLHGTNISKFQHANH